MNYGKLENENLKLLKMPLKLNGADIFTTNENLILQNGYKPLINTVPQNIKGKIPKRFYTETEAEIVENWEYVNEVE